MTTHFSSVALTLLLSATQAFANDPGDPSPPPLQPVTSSTSPESPWRVNNAWGLPEWFDLYGEQRSRYEAFDENFRVGSSNRNHLIAMRTLVAGTFQGEKARLKIEIQDSRQYDAPDNVVLNTGTVNAGEILQAYFGYQFDDAFQTDAHLDVRLGRQTMNIGSRRFISRNGFRNTINGYNGFRGIWTGAKGSKVNAFFVVPVLRLPLDQASLQANDIELDEELGRTQFYGVRWESAPLANRLEAESYVYILDEEDGSRSATRNRDLYTLGLRLHTDPEPNKWHFDWESNYQFGEARRTPLPTDVTDLDHRAHHHHVHVGYKLEGDHQTRIEATFDYASGDDDPTDNENNRFDTLFGSRAFDYGQTGIWGPFARSNIVAYGYRIFTKPVANSHVYLNHRFNYLASDRDVWTTSGLVDPSGQSGDYIGQMIEARFQYDVVPRNWRLELGFGHLFTGGFVDEAPNATGQGDSTYGYLMTTFTF